MIEVTLEKAVNYVRKAWAQGIPVVMLGPKGVGKTEAFRQVAQEKGGRVYELSLTQLESVDLRGLPDTKGNRTRWTEPEFMDINDWAEEDGFAVLSMEEIVSAQPSVQLAAMQIMLDHRIGQHKIDPRVAKGATGNTAIDNAYIYDLCGPLANRTMILYIRPDFEAFFKFALGNPGRIHPMILGYLKTHPEHLHWSYFAKQRKDGSGDTSTEKAEATPRSWEMLSRYLSTSGENEDISAEMPAVAGLVGEPVSGPLVAHWKTISDLTMPEDIEKHPDKAKVPAGMAAKYAMCGIIAQNIKKETSSAYLTYIGRLDREFQTVIFLSLLNRQDVQKWLVETKGFTEWALKNEGAVISCVSIKGKK